MSNYDEKTGISYGVISPHALNPEALNDIYDNGTDPHYESAKEELLRDFKQFCEDHNLDESYINTDTIIDSFSDRYESCGDGQCDFKDSEYELHVSGDNFGIFVIKSPYYTYCRKCSPCAPGAGDLNNPIDMDGAGGKNEPSPYQLFSNQHNDGKTYCLDKSYFDDEKAPYRVFRVDNDEEVL